MQAVKFHRTTIILDNLGNQDITSFVNFHDLVEIAKKNNLHIYGPVTQQEFLKENGIEERKNKILLNASEKQKHMIEKEYERLITHDQMGNIFKFLLVSTYRLTND